MATEWDPRFCPSFTPLEVFELGAFEGKYLNEIKEVPKSWKDKLYRANKHVKPGAPADVKMNYYGVKSRQGLSEWQKKGWIDKEDPEGWMGWYIRYWFGRRIPKIDERQIKRFRSFVARHQAQVSKGCRLNDAKCRPRQRQGLLQWGWDSETDWSPEQQRKNAERIAKLAGAKLVDLNPSEKW